MIEPRLVVYCESAELTQEEWNKLTAIASKVLRKHNLPEIQTEYNQDHWLSNYMRYVNEASNDRHTADDIRYSTDE